MNVQFADTILPGPYTIIAKARRSAPKPVVSKDRSIGIRLPKHPFTGIIAEAGMPFVSTSANISGEETINSIDEVPGKIRDLADWAVDAGSISGRSSRVFDLRTADLKILRY